MKFEKYESYKDSGIEWLGKIPSEWEVKRVKDIGKVILGKMLDNKKDKNKYLKYYLKSKNIVWFRVNIDSIEEMYFTKEELNIYKLKKFDLLLSEGGEVGKTSMWMNELDECYIQNSVHKITLYKNQYSKYFLYLSFILGKINYYNSIVNMVSIKHLTKEKLINVFWLRPPLPTQQKIASFLDKQTQKIDKEISLLTKKIEKYKELKQTLINEVVLRGVDKNIELKPSEVEWIGNIPKHWEVKRLKDIFIERVEKNLNPKTMEPITNNILSVMKDIGVINHKDKGNVGNKMSSDITNYKLVYPDDIVVNKMNVIIGSVGISKEFGALSVVYIILKTKKNSFSKYYHYLFKIKSFQKHLRKIATGILEIREAVNITLFFQENLIQPPLEEQIKIANYLDEKTQKIEQIITTITKKIEVLKEFRKTLINDVVTGKIKV